MSVQVAREVTLLVSLITETTPVDHNLLLDVSVGQIIAMIGTLTAVIAIIRKFGPITRRLNNLLDDWFGEEARPGVHERKGVMQRLEDQDEVLQSIQTKIEPIVDEDRAGNHREVLSRLDANGDRIRAVEGLIIQHIRESKFWVQEVTKRAEEKDFAVPEWPDFSGEVKETPK